MPRPTHPNKEIEAALREAEARGWTVQKRSGHAWAVMMCPHHERGACRASIWSTPRNAENHARQLIRVLERCPHLEEGGTDG